MIPLIGKLFWKKMLIVFLLEGKTYTRIIKLPNLPRIGESIPIHPDVPAFPHLRMKIIDVMHVEERGLIIVTTIIVETRTKFPEALIADLTKKYGYRKDAYQ